MTPHEVLNGTKNFKVNGLMQDAARHAARWYATPSAQQGGDTHDQLSHDEIIERLSLAGVSAHKAESPDQALSLLKDTVTANDVVLLLTSGSMHGLVERIPSWLDETFA